VGRGVGGGCEPWYAGCASLTIKDTTMIDIKRPPLQPHGHPCVAVAYLSSTSANQGASIYYVTGYFPLFDLPPQK